jgi:hypothetical protein
VNIQICCKNNDYCPGGRLAGNESNNVPKLFFPELTAEKQGFDDQAGHPGVFLEPAGGIGKPL